VTIGGTTDFTGWVYGWIEGAGDYPSPQYPLANCPATLYYDPCPSYIDTPWQSYGLLLYSGATRKITQQGYNNCVTNNSGLHYFIPAGSGGELQSFFMLLYIAIMEPRYIDQVKSAIAEFDPQGSNRYFLFGSAVRKKRFHDIDLGVVGNRASRKKLSELRDRFYDSRIPYKVDVVDFDAANDSFRDYVLQNEPIVWIK